MQTPQRCRRPRVIVAATAVAALTAGIVGVMVVGPARADDPPPASTSTPAETFDPVTQALGVETPDEIAELQDAQQELNLISANDGPEADHVNAVRSDLGAAVDELYDGVADDPQAARARDWWRDCMIVRGTAFDSPMAIEEAIDAPRDDLNQLGDHDLRTVLANRDECEDEASTLLAALLEGRFPDWAQEHATTIDEYRTLIEAVSG